MGGGTLLFGEDAGALELELRNGPCPSIEANACNRSFRIFRSVDSVDHADTMTQRQ